MLATSASATITAAAIAVINSGVHDRRATLGRPRRSSASQESGDHHREHQTPTTRPLAARGAPARRTPRASTRPATVTGSRRRMRYPAIDQRGREEHHTAVLADRRRRPLRHRSHDRRVGADPGCVCPHPQAERVRAAWRRRHAAPTARSMRAMAGDVLAVLEPGETEQEWRQHEAAVHVHPHEHERPAMAHIARGWARRPARIQSVTENSSDADQLGSHGQVLTSDPEAGHAQERGCPCRRAPPTACEEDERERGETSARRAEARCAFHPPSR